MIRSLRNKGLKELFRPGRSAKVPSGIEDRIRRRLDMLDQAAEQSVLDIPGFALHRLLKERTRVTPTMALRLGRYCGNGAAIWLRLQDAHDLWLAERESGDEIARIPRRNREAA